MTLDNSSPANARLAVAAKPDCDRVPIRVRVLQRSARVRVGEAVNIISLMDSVKVNFTHYAFGWQSVRNWTTEHLGKPVNLPGRGRLAWAPANL